MSEKPHIAAVVFLALFAGYGLLFGGGSTSSTSSKPVEPATSSAPLTPSDRPTVAPSDPCGWQRPSSMTREECERIEAVAAQLWLERERERNPNFKPFSAVH
jgi:hypothetical protein